ncbi:MAG: ferritin family protein [Xanthobacteraceae bacterium]|nr:ferritin family protein [Xanthobacteraceae bacterium]
MSKTPSERPVTSVADLLALAYQIETDAVQRYSELTEQMETHNNQDLVKLFRDLARAEGAHAEEIRKMAGDIDLTAHAERLARWKKGGSPEEADLGAAHYLMTPWHALQLALTGEKQALAFFTSILDTANDAKIKKMAAEFVEEEAEHVNLVYRLLRKYPKPSDAWSEDDDPPAPQD